MNYIAKKVSSDKKEHFFLCLNSQRFFFLWHISMNKFAKSATPIHSYNRSFLTICFLAHCPLLCVQTRCSSRILLYHDVCLLLFDIHFIISNNQVVSTRSFGYEESYKQYTSVSTIVILFVSTILTKKFYGAPPSLTHSTAIENIVIIAKNTISIFRLFKFVCS